MNARTRIENAVIPMMIHHILNNLVDKVPEQRKFYQNAMDITLEATKEYLGGLDAKREIQLHRRLERLTKQIYEYFIQHKFDTRKSLLVLTIWAFALYEQDALELKNPKYVELLQELDDTFASAQEGEENEIEYFEKIKKSAVKQVFKIHAMAQKMGYY